MSGADIGLGVSVFLACTVEAVEALTIVLAVGSTRSWSAALGGVAAAGVALAALIAALGPELTALPLNALRVAVGGLLLIFGLQWLRKAILRSAGLKAKHDELEIYQEELAAASAAGGRGRGFDGYSFTVAFKGVLLEGLEVAFIVLTFGANQHRVGLAAAAAAAAVLLVAVVGFVARAPLARVPENTLKFAVGVLLTSFGMFWGAEGAGAHWPGGDAALLAIVPGVLLAALALGSPRMRAVARPRRRVKRVGERDERLPRERRDAPLVRGAASLASGVWRFVAGDDSRTAIGVVLALALTALVAALGASAWWTMPVAVLWLLALSIRAEARSALPPLLAATLLGGPT
jgi:uncharacterized membrane protein